MTRSTSLEVPTLMLMLDHLQVASLLLDPKDHIVQMNVPMRSMIDHEIAEGTPFAELVGEENTINNAPHTFISSIHSSGRGHIPVTVHQGPRAADGSRIIQLTPLDDPLVVEELRRSQKFARNIIDSSLDMIIAVDGNSVVTEFNPAACLKFDCEASDVLGRSSKNLYAFPEEYDKIQRELNNHGAFAGEITNISADGERFTVFLAASRLYDGQGKLIGAMGVSRDITPLRQAQQQSAKLKALFESSEHMFWSVDKRIALTSFNRGYQLMIQRLYGTEPEMNQDITKPRKLFANKEYHKFWEERYNEAFTGKVVRFETSIADQKGRPVFNDIFLSPVYSPEGSVVEVLGIGHEITDQKKTKLTVRDQAARLKAIFENSANMMIWTLDTKLKITAFNDHFERTLRRGMGLTFQVKDDFLVRMSEHVADGGSGPSVAMYKAALRGKPQQFETELLNKKGDRVWTETFLNPIVIDGKVKEISCLAHEITDKKLAERKMRDSLNEKEVLLKEVHHRVKNNLQIISSILNLQSDYVDNDPDMLALLRGSQDRIRSMAYIHESLYRNKNFSSIDLADYMDGLSRNLMLSYSINGKVQLRSELEEMYLSLDKAIPCGLILNELISNALKHGFPNERKGFIDVRASLVDGMVTIIIADDGIGLQNDEEATVNNLGLQLVATLIEQLEGTIKRTNDGGVSYLIKFERT